MRSKTRGEKGKNAGVCSSEESDTPPSSPSTQEKDTMTALRGDQIRFRGHASRRRDAPPKTVARKKVVVTGVSGADQAEGGGSVVGDEAEGSDVGDEAEGGAGAVGDEAKGGGDDEGVFVETGGSSEGVETGVVFDEPVRVEGGGLDEPVRVEGGGVDDVVEEEHATDTGPHLRDEDLEEDEVFQYGPEVGGEQANVPKPKKSREKFPDVAKANGLVRSGPFPGGPENNSLLTSFYDHIAIPIWYGVERKPLNLDHHSKKLREWIIVEEGEGAQVDFIEKLSGTGLMALRSYPEICDKALISAFVERWHEETSTFHLPFGEMTITLDDVLQITGLKVKGDFKTPLKLSSEPAAELVRKCLGVDDMDSIKSEFKKAQAPAVILEWIRGQCAQKMSSSDPQDLLHAV